MLAEYTTNLPDLVGGDLRAVRGQNDPGTAGMAVDPVTASDVLLESQPYQDGPEVGDAAVPVCLTAEKPLKCAFGTSHSVPQ
jgi:hypothetical protein